MKKSVTDIISYIISGAIIIYILIFGILYLEFAIAQYYIKYNGEAVLNVCSIAQKISNYKNKNGRFPKEEELKIFVKELKLEGKIEVLSAEKLNIKCGKAIKGNIDKNWIEARIDKKDNLIKFEDGYTRTGGKKWPEVGLEW